MNTIEHVGKPGDRVKHGTIFIGPDETTCILTEVIGRWLLVRLMDGSVLATALFKGDVIQGCQRLESGTEIHLTVNLKED